MVYPLITLYSPEETEFVTNGLGSLSEAKSCVVTEEANGGFELEMVYPVNGRRYRDLATRSIIFAKPNPVDPPQPFRIYEISRPMNGMVTFYASHISYDLSGYPVSPFTAENAVKAMAGLKEHSVVEHPFEFWTDKEVESTFTLTTPYSIRGILAGVRGSILDTYRGEYKFNRFRVELYSHRGVDRGVTIRYGKNLTDFQQEEKCSKVFTGVYPYWQEFEGDTLVELPEKIVPTPGTYNFTNIYTLDLSSEFEEPPSEEDLRKRAEKYISDNDLGVPTVSLKVSFTQLEQTEEYKHLTLLERVELFDTVTVEFPEMNVSSTSNISKTVYDVLAGRYSSVTVGEIRASISDTIINQDDAITQTASVVGSEISTAVSSAVNWIVNGRGYIVAVKNSSGDWVEICSLDSPDIGKAINVWRWNNEGIAHSSDGHNGSYEVAITQDGHIVADFVDKGVLQTEDGETFYLDFENGVFKSDGSIIQNGAIIQKLYVGTTEEDLQEGYTGTVDGHTFVNGILVKA